VFTARYAPSPLCITDMFRFVFDGGKKALSSTTSQTSSWRRTALSWCLINLSGEAIISFQGTVSCLRYQHFLHTTFAGGVIQRFEHFFGCFHLLHVFAHVFNATVGRVCACKLVSANNSSPMYQKAPACRWEWLLLLMPQVPVSCSPYSD
jgi:hypothetical protein